ncbi:hypothetical protein GF312_19080 [Candidatus Poribacteria bacterium]|nr:hypothetical protein [Candidatus Poribacteria bacterium]
MFGIFSKRRKKRENLTVVYSTRDDWEAEVVRTALLNEGIKAYVEIIKDEDKNRKTTVSVPAAKLKEAEMVIRRTSLVIMNKENIIAEQEEREKNASKQEKEKKTEEQYTEVAEKKPVGEPELLAEKDGTGKILYYEEADQYELRLEFEFYKKSHFMPAEEWEEFIDFSAQRQEFFILLKEKYPQLASLVKENKMRADLLKLIEYSYGKSTPPKN